MATGERTLVQKVVPTFRSRDRMGGEKHARIPESVQKWLERYVATERLLIDGGHGPGIHFQWPEGFPCLVRDVTDAEVAAHQLREALDLGQDPIEDVTAFLEDHGILVRTVDAHEDFIACTLWAEIEDGEQIPVIAIRSDLSGDRQRFSLVRELAQLFVEFPEDMDETESAKATDRFAAAFLVPAEAARLELGLRRQSISQYELLLLKHKYGLSMQGWICRAQDVGILSDIGAQRFLEPFCSLDQETAHEPGDSCPTERSTLLERMVMRALSEDLIDERGASELLGMPFSQFSEQFVKEHGVDPFAARI